VAYTFKHGDRPIDGTTIQRAIGRGGFGEVYYALTDSGKQVAVKYLRDNPDVELRGIAHVMNLKSPHLITIYDVRHSEEGDPYVIMEYVSGPSLRELLIAEPNGLGPQKAVFFLNGIAKGLNYLHERGIVHRDLKPGNIFYDDGYVKIGDYGLSKHIAVSAHSGNTISVGTVHYMAPEIGSGSYTKSIDIYALGVMLYEMLTGRLPFTGSSMGEVLMRHLSEQPDVSGIPEPFAAVIAKALAKDPKDRYQDVDEMVEALTSATDVSESLLPPIPPIPPVLDGKAAKKARKLQKKARKLQAKAEKKAQAVRAKLADLGIGPAAPDSGDAGRPLGRKRWQQVVITLIVLFAVSGGFGVAFGDGAVFGASLLFLLLGTIGILLAYKLSVRRNSIEYDFQDRLLYAACGFVFMLPAFAAGLEVYRYGEQFARLIIPLTAVLLIFNWTDRVRMGRRQIISGATVFWHAVAGLFFSAAATEGVYALVGAALSATLLILVQSVAGLWPVAMAAPSRPLGPQKGRDRHQRVWERLEGAYQRVTTAVESAGERLERATKHVGQEIDRRTSKPIEVNAGGAAEADEPEKRQAAAEQQLAQAARADVGCQPSFVGRTANAGLSFLAKLLLLAGLAVALLFSCELVNVDAHGTRVKIGGGQVLVAEHGRVEVQEEIPRAAVFAPLLLGSVLLIVARRNDGAAHFVRGFFGCVLACVAAVVALGPAATEMSLFFEGNWDKLESSDRFEPLIVVAVILIASLLLLFWPKPAWRGEKPIVI